MEDSSIGFYCVQVDFKLDNEIKANQWLRETIRAEGQQHGDISIIFCSDDHLHGLNQEYLAHDTLTDIITFDYSTSEAISGDIFISIDRVKENAEKFGQSLSDELCRVMIHGVLHLLGYKDKTPADKAAMTSKEDYYLNLRPF